MLLRSYFLLFIGSLAIHSFALMISTVSDKGGASSGVLLLLLLQVLPSLGWLFVMGAKTSAPYAAQGGDVRFYGIVFPEIFLWASLELGLVAWFLLAVVRNIKVSLEAIQLFTVRQGVGFAAYCNFVWIGFYPWQSGPGATSIGPLLLMSVVLFYVVGIGVLRSRDLVRRGLSDITAALSESRRFLGPIGSLTVAAVLTEILIVTLALQYSHAPAARVCSS